MINGEADDARTVLGELLTKHFTAPDDTRDVNWYADALANKSKQYAQASTQPDTSPWQAATPTQLAAWTGTNRATGFGDTTLCPHVGRGRFPGETATSPTRTEAR